MKAIKELNQNKPYPNRQLTPKEIKLLEEAKREINQRVKELQKEQYPETREAIERWHQGKINIFDEMSRLEKERDALKQAYSMQIDLVKALEKRIDRLEKK